MIAQCWGATLARSSRQSTSCQFGCSAPARDFSRSIAAARRWCGRGKYLENTRSAVVLYRARWWQPVLAEATSSSKLCLRGSQEEEEEKRKKREQNREVDWAKKMSSLRKYELSCF
jgi:hypothetical protein